MARSNSPLARNATASSSATGLIMAVAKRVGLGPAMLRLTFEQMFSVRSMRAAFEGYAPSEYDVFVSTFAKSGTNWMMQIAQQISHRGAAEFEHIHQVVPWPDAPGEPIGDVFDRSEVGRSPTGLRVIKTHLAPEFVPYAETAKYLTVFRDPKEVVVSSYHFIGGIFGLLDYVSFDRWFELSLGPAGLIERWALHTAGFWAWRDRPNVLVINYGAVIEDPVVSIRRVAEIMGVELSAASLDAVVERSSFAYMRAHESQFAPPPFPFAGKRAGARMIRRGRARGSDELLDPTQQLAVDRVARRELDRLGSDFPYAETYERADAH